MSELTEKVKIQRTRKRIYEMDHKEASETEVVLQESVAVMALPSTEIAVEAAPETASETVAAEVSVCSTGQDHEEKDRHEEIYKILRESEPDSEFLKETVGTHNRDSEERDRHERIYEILREYEPESEYLQQTVGTNKQETDEENWEKDDQFHSAMTIVYTYSAVSAATGLIPVPLVDMAGFMATQLMMLKKLCKLYDIPFDSQRSKSAIAILASGINSAYLAASSSKLIPLIGAFSIAAMPAVNGALSYAVGRVFIKHFASGGTFLDFDPNKVRGYFEEQYRAGKLRLKGKDRWHSVKNSQV